MTLDFADDGLSVVTHVSWIDSVGIYPVAGINLLINGGFELPDYVGPSHNVNPVVPGWIFTAGIAGAGSGIDRGDLYVNSGSIGFEGAQQAFLQSSGNGSVMSISQVVSNFISGRYYRLSFLAKAIGTYSGANPFQVEIIEGTTTNRLFGGGDVVPGPAGYTLYTSEPFPAGSSAMTLRFSDHGLSDSTHVSWIDGASIYALPISLGAQPGHAGQFQIQFIGDSNLSYTILGATNLSSPFSAWEVMGTALYQGDNSFRFNDTTTNFGCRFYQVRLP